MDLASTQSEIFKNSYMYAYSKHCILRRNRATCTQYATFLMHMSLSKWPNLEYIAIMCHFKAHILSITNVCEGMEYGGNEKPGTTS